MREDIEHTTDSNFVIEYDQDSVAIALNIKDRHHNYVPTGDAYVYAIGSGKRPAQVHQILPIRPANRIQPIRQGLARITVLSTESVQCNRV